MRNIEPENYDVDTGVHKISDYRCVSAFEAEQLCSYLIGLQADYEKYRGVNYLVEEVLTEFAMDVEKYSMDEYFIDVNLWLMRPRKKCMKRARPELKKLLSHGFSIRGIAIGTIKLDMPNQADLFFQQDSKMLNYYLAQDAINNEEVKGTIQKASIKYEVHGKTHFFGAELINLFQ